MYHIPYLIQTTSSLMSHYTSLNGNPFLHSHWSILGLLFLASPNTLLLDTHFPAPTRMHHSLSRQSITNPSLWVSSRKMSFLACKFLIIPSTLHSLSSLSPIPSSSDWTGFDATIPQLTGLVDNLCFLAAVLTVTRLSSLLDKAMVLPASSRRRHRSQCSPPPLSA